MDELLKRIKLNIADNIFCVVSDYIKEGMLDLINEPYEYAELYYDEAADFSVNEEDLEENVEHIYSDILRDINITIDEAFNDLLEKYDKEKYYEED